MRVLAILASLALAIAAAGCIKDDPVEAATDEETPPEVSPEPVDPTPATPSSPPPASTPPPASPPATAPPPAEEPEPAPPEPRVDVFAWNGSITAVGAGTSTPAGADVCCAQVAAPDSSNADIEFEVPSGLKGIVVELAWTDAQFDLDLLVTAPDYEATPSPPSPYTGHRWFASGGAPGQPDGKVSLVLTEEEALALAGAWAAHASAKGPANAVAFTLFVSLFYDEPPGSDYTAAAQTSFAPSDNP